MVSSDNPDDPDDPHHTLKVLQRLNLRLDELARDDGPTAEQLQSRLDVSAQNTIIIQLDRLIGVLIESARSSLASTEENLRLQREVRGLTAQMKWLGVGALIFAVVACILAGGQFRYAMRADLRAIPSPARQSQPAIQPKKPAPLVP